MTESNYGAMKETQNPTGKEPLLQQQPLPREGKRQQTDQERFGFCGCWAWWKANMWERREFIYWIAFACSTFLLVIIFYSLSEDAGLIVTGILVILVCLYGYRTFWVLLAIREQVNEFEENNRNFRRENTAMSSEVDRLEKAKQELQDMENTLKDAKERNERNLAQFKELDKNLQASGSNNLSDLKEVQERSKNMMETWRNEMISNEKNLVMEVFDRVDDQDDVDGITTRQFSSFLDLLPERYAPRKTDLKKRFTNAAGDDKQLSNEEFEDVLDRWIEGNVKDRVTEKDDEKSTE